jgi:serine/threonine protein phosphatase PrpC
MKFSVFQISRRGNREKNEDRMGYCYTRGSGLFLLADGMGGHPEGEVAAQLALQTLSAMYQKAATPQIDDASGFLSDAVLAAHRQILRYALDRGMADTPRTTIVAALVQNGAMSWAHCGDSRLYLVRDGEMLARTRDHSYQEQRNVTPMAGKSAFQGNRNILFTCLGSPTKPIIDITGPIALEQGDRVLLCSDGLWGSVSDPDIVQRIADKEIPLSVPDLVDAALKKANGTSDNVTVIAFEWETPSDAPTPRNSISTEDIEDGGFASTMQVDAMEVDIADLQDMDEAAIERSIAEINDAIKRSAARKR